MPLVCLVRPMRPTWDEYFLSIAFITSSRSHDSQTKVGCVIVNDNKIIGTGYNGFPRRFPNDLPSSRPLKYKWVVHAEVNAILNCVNYSLLNDSTLYVTHVPCIECLKIVYQAGISRIVFPERLTNMGSSSDYLNDWRGIVALAESNGLRVDIIKDVSFIKDLLEGCVNEIY